MANYLRQLRNDEKRRTFSMVGSVTPDIATVATTAIPLFVIPKRSTIARIYVVNKDAFAAGSEVTFEIYRGSEVGKVLFTAHPLDTGTIAMGDGDGSGRWDTDEYVSCTFNQAAVDSVTGEAQLVIEFTEVPVCAGAYSK